MGNSAYYLRPRNVLLLYIKLWSMIELSIFMKLYVMTPYWTAIGYPSVALSTQ